MRTDESHQELRDEADRQETAGEPPLLKIHGATVVKGGRRVLDDVILTIRPGEHTAILGPNGSGKSSLMKLLTRDYYPLAHPDGRSVVRLLGEDRWDVATLRSILGIVTPDLHHLFASADSRITGAEAALSGFFGGIGLAVHHHVTEMHRERARAALDDVGVRHLADKPLSMMSTGEARRILIARALAPAPKALVLDEPTSGLDLPTTHHFLETIRAVARRRTTVLLVTHHVEEIFPEIERVILIKYGRIFRDGPKAALLTSETLSALFDVPIHVRPAARTGFFAAEAA